MNSRMFFTFARAMIEFVGSEPVDKIQTKGVRGSDSAHVNSKSKMCVSLYSGPSDSGKNLNL
jgi:hypothetical protein